MKIKRVIDMQTRFGNKRTIRKEFNDEKHLSNWIRWMNRNGRKIIGVHNFED